jgi:long-chain acyl-CoA synthetase
MNQPYTNVTDYLLEGKEPDRIALRFSDRAYVYGELQRSAMEIAAYILQIGGHKGDRVILICDNSFFWVAAYLGILRAGLICVPLPANLSTDVLCQILRITEARIAFIQAGLATRFESHFRECHIVTDQKVSIISELASLRSLDDARQYSDMDRTTLSSIEPDDLAALMFTSGSTGKPRGVMVSHANIMANTRSIIEYLALSENDRIMTVLPFHYCFGTSLLHTHLRVGGSLVIDSRFMYPETILKRMIDSECTGFAGVPSHFQILLRSSSLRKKIFPHLRYVQQAGGHLAPSFVRELREALPATQVFVMYGQTEATARLSYLAPEFLRDKQGSIGKGIPGVKLEVLDERGDKIRPGEVGEIVAEGENIAKGYWRSSGESANVFRKGKLYTGDLATVDDDGFIYVVDRAKDFLKCGGKRISCRQIEEQMLDFEDLLEAAVIGIPDEILGEAVKAFVVPRSSAADVEARLRFFCKQRMPPQLIPKDIVVLKNLPKNDAGKVLKQSLKNMIS